MTDIDKPKIFVDVLISAVLTVVVEAILRLPLEEALNICFKGHDGHESFPPAIQVLILLGFAIPIFGLFFYIRTGKLNALFAGFRTAWSQLTSEQKTVAKYFTFGTLLIVILMVSLVFLILYWAKDAILERNLAIYGIKPGFNGNRQLLKFDDRYPLNIQSNSLNPISYSVHVIPYLGWQNSYIKVQAHEKYKIKVEGRVHVALGQINEEMKYSKAIIVQNADPKSELYSIFSKNPLDSIDLRNTEFKNSGVRRYWTNGAGSEYPDDLLDGAKLGGDGTKYGQVLWTVLDSSAIVGKDLGNLDPFQVLLDANVNIDQYPLAALAPYPSEENLIQINRSGYLSFIVNDVVVSKASNAPQRSKDIYNSFQNYKHANIKYPDFSVKEIPDDAIPLFFYSDNIGLYILEITKSE